MSDFDKMFNFDEMKDPECNHDDCGSLMDTAKIVMSHIREHFMEQEHREMEPPCVICITFHIAHQMGLTVALRHPDSIPLDLRRKILSDDFPDPFED